MKTGFRGPRILQIAGIVGMLLAVGYSPPEAFPSTAATEPPATPTAEHFSPFLVLAAGGGARPDASSELVWLVQRGAASGEQRTDLAAFPLGFVLADRGTLVIFDAEGTRTTDLGPGRATLLPTGERGSFGSANGDLVLYVQISLVPVATVPDALPRGMLASEPFLAAGGTTLGLELMRGILNPTRATDLPSGAMPLLVLATESAIELETARGDVVDIPMGGIFLLAEPATVRNPGNQPATFVMARSTLAESATPRPEDQAGLDPALVDAWHHYGCHLNPGNPSCVTVGIAAGCAIDAPGPSCSVDSDGDRCTDVAEAEAGFDPFDSADCIGSAGGQPAVNCLFPTENLACNGNRIPAPEESECVAEREIRQRRNPSNFSGCDEVDQPPPDECVYNARDPGCDGFARESS